MTLSDASRNHGDLAPMRGTVTPPGERFTSIGNINDQTLTYLCGR